MVAEAPGGESLDFATACRCLQRLPQAVVLLADDGRTIRWFNDAAPAVFGSGDGAHALASSVPMEQVLSPSHREALQALFDGIQAGGDGQLLWTRLEQGQPSTWLLSWRRLELGVLLTAQDQAPWLEQERQRRDRESERRERLIREVHHRLKNSLQGVSGLLLRVVDAHPEAREAVVAAVSQIRILADVHDLQLRGEVQPRLSDLLLAVVRSMGSADAPRIEVLMPDRSAEGTSTAAESDGLRGLLWAHLDGGSGAPDAASRAWRLSEADAPSLGLCLGELLRALLSQAPFGTGPATVTCELTEDADGASLVLRASGRWPDGWDPARLSPGLQGLPLAKALLPRRGAALHLVQEDTKVCAALRLTPPCLVADAPAAPQSAW